MKITSVLFSILLSLSSCASHSSEGKARNAARDLKSTVVKCLACWTFKGISREGCETISKIMLQNGLTDSFREMNPDPVTNLGLTWYWSGDGVKGRMDRIDFIYYTGEKLKAVRSESYNTDLSDTLDFKREKFFYASGHGFVLTTFILNH